MSIRRIVVSLLIVLFGARLARADGLFDLTAQTTGGPPQTISVSGNNLVDLTKNLLKAQDGFTGVSAAGYSANLTYAGVTNAAVLTSNANGTSVTLSFPRTGFSQTFTGTSRSDVETQIKNFIEKDGASAYARDLKIIDEKSTVAVADGNPQAAAPFFATAAFDRFGMGPTYGLLPTGFADSSQFRIQGDAGAITTPDGNGSYVSLDLASTARFGDHFALTLDIPMEYRDIDSASTYMAAVELGLPITIITLRGNGIGWQVTPWGVLGGAGSEDMAAGAAMAGGGGTSDLAIRIGALTFSIVDQFSRMTGVPLRAGDYKFDSDVDSKILKNGGKVTFSPGPLLFIDAGVSYTNLLNRSAVPDYWSPDAGIGFHIGGNTGLRVGYSGDYGHHYHSYGGDIELFISY